MPKLSFLVGLAAGYVLGAKAGKQRYEQIKALSGQVWQSQPVQNQVGAAKEAARTKAAPVVADFVADAARSAGEKLRNSATVVSEVTEYSHREPPAEAQAQASEPMAANPGSATSR